MTDPTESTRRLMAGILNALPGSREAMEETYGQVWDTAQVQADYNVTGFAAPFVMVTRKADGARGTLTFQHSPRFYWGFRADS